MAFDYKKEYKEFYLPKDRPELVTVPRMNFAAVRGKCDVTRSVSKMTEIERRGGKRWDKPKKAEKSRDCGGGKF